jgi:CRISPR/Cas system CMR subunit Cmr6 (Cas7 group RAMP superfamily)
MSTISYLPRDTCQVVSATPNLPDGRSLFFDRFALPHAKDKDRQTWFEQMIRKPAVKIKVWSWPSVIVGLAPKLVFGQLQSRLMVNMAGGVMENAGLCLDRFGVPYIPGSAVKGCARRAAIAALHEWCATGDKPGGSDNPLAPGCEPFNTPEEMLAAIARVFGWADLDWNDQPKQSDFAWACGDAWPAVRKAVVHQLAAELHVPLKADDPEPWKSLPNVAGSVSFLPAYPVDLGRTGKVEGLPLEVPELGELELDVVTCHHRDYYRGDRKVATDDEDPNPVVFPAVAPGHVFAFALAPMRGADPQTAEHARTWLKIGLKTFGLGAKTNAGYGWFECSEPVQQAVRQALEEVELRRRAERARLQEEQRRRKEEEERRRRAEELKRLTEGMTPEQKADFELAQLTDEQFRGRLDNFTKRDPEEQKAMVRALRMEPGEPHSRRHFWEELKSKARKGGKYARIEQDIRKLSKEMNLGKMP